jgi:hypothetical protein
MAGHGFVTEEASGFMTNGSGATHFLKVYGRRQRLGVQKPANSARASALIIT